MENYPLDLKHVMKHECIILSQNLSDKILGDTIQVLIVQPNLYTILQLPLSLLLSSFPMITNVAPFLEIVNIKGETSV